MRRWGLCSIAVFLFAHPLSAANLVFVPLTPCRVIDSSIAGGIFAAGETRSYTLRGPGANYSAYGGSAAGCGLPDLVNVGFNKQNAALALALNVTAKNATGKGNFLAFPTNHAATASSTLNFNGIVTTPVNNGMNIANGAIIAMCDQVAAAPCGTGDISVKASFGSAFLIVDVVGYFSEGETLLGTGNLALGHRALGSNTTGARNTAAGYDALATNTSGFRNTATGYRALRSNSTGFYNLASGDAALFNNTTGHNNSASGEIALYYNTTGSYNTANGAVALISNTSGDKNTASGAQALVNNTVGHHNTASGFRALQSNGAGYLNTAEGAYALVSNTSGYRNTASGVSALRFNVAGNFNTALGYRAGFDTTGNHNLLLDNSGGPAENGAIRIGNSNHVKTFLAGVRGATTLIADAIPVVIDSSGQLGTISSSLRFKKEVMDMGSASERMMKLRPVTFRYKQELRPGEQPLEYGLIAEEVAEVFPELAVYGSDGRPETVKYHVLPALLLNELERQQLELTEQRSKLVSEQAARVVMEERLKAQGEQLAAQQEANTDLRRDLGALRRELQAMREARDEPPRER